jgi:geranylgeranyl reductase family protein
MRRFDAVVVGAGPAGSATALLLARAGADVLLLDRARFPRDKPCSEYLSPETTRLLERLGADVLAEVEGAAHAKLYGMKVVAPDGREMYGSFTGQHGWASPRPYGFALPRTRFDAILRGAAERAGAVVREETAVEDLLYDRGAVGGVVARTGLGNRETYRSRVVVGADGLRSVVARRLGLRRDSPPRRIAFSAHVAGAAEVGAYGEMHISRLGYVGLGPIGDGVTTVALVLPRRALLTPHPRRDYRTAFLNELERFPKLRGRFTRARLVREVLVTGPFAQWSRRSLADGGGAMLVGDAADFFDPFTGQGIYSALRGAELAADALLAALAVEPGSGPLPREALAPYARARRRAFAGKWVLERLIGFGVGWPALATRVIDRLARHPDLGDLVVGATGNFVPARAVLAPRTLARLLW